LCHISAAGLTLLAELDQPVHALDEAVLGCLQPEEVRQLIALLDRIRQHNS
jgi:DNA-binding MarR family transcriptional regulator